MPNTVAIVTLYNPDSEVPERARILADQVTTVILSDNTPDRDNRELFADIPNALYLPNGRNLGLSGALNRGLKTPEAERSDYVFFFDQDSRIPEGHIDTMVRDWETLAKDHRIGLLGPSYFDETTGTENVDSFLTKDTSEGPYRQMEQMITSSLMSRIEILREINFWNEDIFLDYADFDLCWRLLKAGYELYMTKNTMMRHRLGEGFVWAYDPGTKQKFKLSYGAPLRRYYQTRAAVKLLRTDYVPEEWRKWLKLNLTRRRYFEKKYLPERRKVTRYYIRGLIDGWLGKNGEFTKRY